MSFLVGLSLLEKEKKDKQNVKDRKDKDHRQKLPKGIRDKRLRWGRDWVMGRA